MKKLLILALLASTCFVNAQSNQDLIKHYEAYYKQMKVQGDVQGIINGLTHLNVLMPSQARKDTLAYIYMSEGKHLQALNTIGIEQNVTDSKMATETKAIALKSVGQPKLAIPHFEALFSKSGNPLVAYELAELNLQINNLVEAQKHVDFGIANAKEDMMMPFYETKPAYQVPLKAAFNYMSALVKYNQNKSTNIDVAVALLDEAIKMAPNFQMALISKNAILSQKAEATKED